MANASLGDVSVTLDGVEYTLRMDFNAYCEIETALGRPMAEVIPDGAAGVTSARDVRGIFWGALRRHHPEITLNDAGDLLGAHAAAIGDAIGRAARAANPEPTVPAGGKPKVERRR